MVTFIEGNSSTKDLSKQESLTKHFLIKIFHQQKRIGNWFLPSKDRKLEFICTNKLTIFTCVCQSIYSMRYEGLEGLPFDPNQSPPKQTSFQLTLQNLPRNCFLSLLFHSFQTKVTSITKLVITSLYNIIIIISVLLKSKPTSLVFSLVFLHSLVESPNQLLGLFFYFSLGRLRTRMVWVSKL